MIKKDIFNMYTVLNVCIVHVLNFITETYINMYSM